MGALGSDYLARVPRGDYGTGGESHFSIGVLRTRSGTFLYFLCYGIATA
jgi:hypothetical protein